MANTPAQNKEHKSPGGFILSDKAQTQLTSLLSHGDIALALGVVAILVVLILPMPPALLDFALAISMTLSVLILMVVLLVERPLAFSSFPTVLLIATLMRLALNLASTRLILSQGHAGTAAAGKVIEAFGNFMMSGNFIIGIIVFSILVLVNFVVITKGSGRIAEVSARFSLDALPGKQMAVDADLSSGLIDENQARARRQELEAESNFFGSMDGAAKFVRGDAIAGLLITLINIIGGIIIGVQQNGLSLLQAARSYTLLTVGDGLVTQIPALVVSMAAGLLVAKTASQGAANRVIFSQFTRNPSALNLSAVLMMALAFLPGIPFIPFASLAALAGGSAWLARAYQRSPVAADPEPKAEITPEEDASAALQLDIIRVELGYGLLSLIDDQGCILTDQIKALRRQLAQELGFFLPSVRIQDNLQLKPSTYVVRIKEIEAGIGDLRINMLLTMDPRGEAITLAGEETREPTFNLPAMWISPEQREEALLRGYTVVDPATVLTTHLTEIVRCHLPELLSYSETQKLLDERSKTEPKLISDLIPQVMSVSTVQRVLQNLLSERVSIRDLSTILESLFEAGASRNVLALTEHVRSRLSRQLCSAHGDEEGQLPIIVLAPEWETIFQEALIGDGEERQLTMAPSQVQGFIKVLGAALDRQALAGAQPVLLTSPLLRPYIRSLVERFRPATVVLSQNEIHSRVRLRTLERLIKPQEKSS